MVRPCWFTWVPSSLSTPLRLCLSAADGSYAAAWLWVESLWKVLLCGGGETRTRPRERRVKSPKLSKAGSSKTWMCFSVTDRGVPLCLVSVFLKFAHLNTLFPTFFYVPALFQDLLNSLFYPKFCTQHPVMTRRKNALCFIDLFTFLQWRCIKTKKSQVHQNSKPSPLSSGLSSGWSWFCWSSLRCFCSLTCGKFSRVDVSWKETRPSM